MKDYKLIIEADANDGDYIERSYDVSKERVEKIREMLSKIDRGYGIGTEDYEIRSDLIERYNLSQDDIEWWQDFLPNNELTYGYSRLESVTILPLIQEEKLY